MFFRATRSLETLKNEYCIVIKTSKFTTFENFFDVIIHILHVHTISTYVYSWSLPIL